MAPQAFQVVVIRAAGRIVVAQRLLGARDPWECPGMQVCEFALKPRDGVPYCLRATTQEETGNDEGI